MQQPQQPQQQMQQPPMQQASMQQPQQQMQQPPMQQASMQQASMEQPQMNMDQQQNMFNSTDNVLEKMQAQRSEMIQPMSNLSGDANKDKQNYFESMDKKLENEIKEKQDILNAHVQKVNGQIRKQKVLIESELKRIEMSKKQLKYREESLLNREKDFSTYNQNSNYFWTSHIIHEDLNNYGMYKTRLNIPNKIVFMEIYSISTEDYQSDIWEIFMPNLGFNDLPFGIFDFNNMFPVRKEINKVVDTLELRLKSKNGNEIEKHTICMRFLVEKKD